MIAKISSLKIEAFLKTAGIEEAYNKYYKDIPKEIFNELVATDPTATRDSAGIPKKIGTYGQWILRMYQQQSLKLEDLYKVTRDLKTLKNLVPLLKKENISIDINKFKTPNDLFAFVRENKTRLAPNLDEVGQEAFPGILLTEAYYLDNEEAKKVYEDENIAIFTPLTLEASQFYGDGSDWCTLFPDRFKQYSSEDNLWIIVFKKGKYDDRWQFHFPSQQFMDFNDDPIEQDSLDYFYRENPLVEKFFQKHYASEETLDKIMQGQEYLERIVPGLKGIVENSSRRDGLNLSVIESWMTGEEIYEVESGMRLSDILRYMEISENNLQIIVTYLETNHSAEMADLGIEFTEPYNTRENLDNLKDALLNLSDVDDLTSAISFAYDDSLGDAIASNIRNYINSALTDHFRVDFSNWFPDEQSTVKISRQYLKSNWQALAGGAAELNSKDISKYLVITSGKIESSELSYAIDSANNNAEVSEELFNEQLTYRLDNI